MRTKLLLSTIAGIAAWSISQGVFAGWLPGQCDSNPGPAPCIEAKINGTYYHFNGNGGHAGEWHGSPTGGDFMFSGPSELNCLDIDANCTLALYGQVMKCEDSNGDWRLGVKVTNYNISPSSGTCGLIRLGGFPWYANEDVLPHCPFGSTCDDFVPYQGNVPHSAVIGGVNISVILPLVTNGHVHGVTFNPGPSTNFSFNSDFYNCSEGVTTCSVNGILYLNGPGSGDEINLY